MRAAITLWPLSRVTARVLREVDLWRWRRQRAQVGAPVTLARRRPPRGYTLESRRPGL